MLEKLNDRMKSYEKMTSFDFLNDEIVIVRLDGKGFSKFTKQFEKPFSKRFSDAMVKTASEILEITGAKIAYTQSDEITLVYFCMNSNQQHFFNGSLQKIVSTTAAYASVIFSREIGEINERDIPVFDSRAFTVPSLSEAANCLKWRFMDCKRNAISMMASSMFKHKQLQGVSTEERLSMIESSGKTWDDVPAVFRRGSLIHRKSYDIGEGVMRTCNDIYSPSVDFVGLSFEEIFRGVFETYEKMSEYKKSRMT